MQAQIGLCNLIFVVYVGISSYLQITANMEL